MVVLLVGVLLAVVGVRWLQRDRRTGPDPTVAPADSCDGSAPGAVLALDAGSGALRWSALVGEAGQVGVAPPVVAVAGGGRVRALALDDGVAAWCRDVRDSGDAANGVAVAGDRVVGVDGGEVVALEAADGRVAWRRSGSWDRLASAGDLAVLTRRDRTGFRRTEAFDAADGRLRWRSSKAAGPGTLTTPTALLTSPQWDLAYLDDDSSIGAVTTAGDGRWTVEQVRPVGVLDPYLVGLDVGVNTERQEVRLDVMSSRSGSHEWRKTVPGFDAVLAGGRIAVLDQTNGTSTVLSRDSSTVRGYELADGADAWEVDIGLGGELFAAGDLAVVELGSADGSLVAIDAPSGRIAWKARLDNPGRTSRRDAADRVLDVAFDGSTGTLFVLLRAEPDESD